MSEETFFVTSGHDLRNARYSITVGIEYARSLLQLHDQDCGRTTRKNKVWAEQMEADIEQMKSMLSALPFPEPPLTPAPTPVPP